MLHSISGLEVDLGHKFQSGYGYFFKLLLLLLLLLILLLLLLILLIILKVVCSY